MRKVLAVTVLFLLAARGAAAADGYVERMSREHTADSPVASPAAQEAPAGKVSAAEVVYGEVEGKAPRVGVIGWCFGGHWSLQTALILHGDTNGAVIHYGRFVTDPEELKVLDMPLPGIFSAEDRGIPVENVRAFEKALGDLGKDAEIRVYEGAEYAFANPSGTRYKEDAAADAWEKTTDFFRKHLRGKP